MQGGGLSAPNAFRWQLLGAPGPALVEALRLGEAVRAAVMRAGNRIGLARLPAAFHGTARGGPHDHAYWLSEDWDDDGRIDHVLVYAASGLPPALILALALSGPVWLGAGAEWGLEPVWMGGVVGGLFGPARAWEAVTAYVTARWRTDRFGRARRGLDPEAQLRREMALRGFPPPLAIDWLDGAAATAARRFVTATKARRAPADSWQGRPEVVFAEPVRGPLAFGFGAHFGLGLLRPTPA